MYFHTKIYLGVGGKNNEHTLNSFLMLAEGKTLRKRISLKYFKARKENYENNVI